jgi:Holliday junction resolvase RusA-like endonuclease
MEVKFTIPGTPCGKGRPKFSRQDNFIRTYTPESTASYENLVKLYYQQNHKITLIGAIKVDIVAYFSIPKSTSKKQRQLMLDGIVRPTKKPDFDNIGKIICDALNKIAYDDDSQIVEANIYKVYADIPRVEVTLTEVVK